MTDVNLIDVQIERPIGTIIPEWDGETDIPEWDMEAEDLARERYQAFLENEFFEEEQKIEEAIRCAKHFLRSPTKVCKDFGYLKKSVTLTPLLQACMNYASTEHQKRREAYACCHEMYHSIKCWHTWDERLTDFVCSQIWEHLANTGCITPLLKCSGTNTNFYKLVFIALWPNIQHFLAKRRADILPFL